VKVSKVSTANLIKQHVRRTVAIWHN